MGYVYLFAHPMDRDGTMFTGSPSICVCVREPLRCVTCVQGAGVLCDIREPQLVGDPHSACAEATSSYQPNTKYVQKWSLKPVQSCPWVGLTHRFCWVELGWFGSGWVKIFQFFVGWVGSTTAKVLKIERIILMHLKHG